MSKLLGISQSTRSRIYRECVPHVEPSSTRGGCSRNIIHAQRRVCVRAITVGGLDNDVNMRNVFEWSSRLSPFISQFLVPNEVPIPEARSQWPETIIDRLVADEPVEFEKSPVEVQDFRKIAHHFRWLYGAYLKLMKIYVCYFFVFLRQKANMPTCQRQSIGDSWPPGKYSVK